MVEIEASKELISSKSDKKNQTASSSDPLEDIQELSPEDIEYLRYFLEE